MDEFETWSRSLSSQDALAVLDRYNVPAAPYRTVKEVMNDPQLDHRQAFAEVRDKGGTFKVLNPPFRLSDSQVRAGVLVPSLGEHTTEVLLSAGLSSEEIQRRSTN
jgi:crotonobetainyl-CoA:carnitine CoA-transferase CaiB-like acyl-CoA transferase